MRKNEVTLLLKSLEEKDGISEIILNDGENIYIERNGDLIRLNISVPLKDILEFIKDVAEFNKVSFGANNPIIDGNLPDGSRINIISSVYTNSAPAITIRKYIRSIKSFDSFPDIFGLDSYYVDLFKAFVQSKCNVLVSGGTGRGKTTFLNLLLQEISPIERIVTIEDTRELSFDIPNTVRLFSKIKAHSISNPLSTRELLKNTLRMRPDRIIIGEVRGEEAFDLLQAMNTGHAGSMCTIHARDSIQALSRLENLFMFAGVAIPLRVARSQICSAIDFIIQLERTEDGDRVVSSITEVCSMEGDTILTQEIAKYEDNKLSNTGIVPKCMERLKSVGLESNYFV